MSVSVVHTKVSIHLERQISWVIPSVVRYLHLVMSLDKNDNLQFLFHDLGYLDKKYHTDTNYRNCHICNWLKINYRSITMLQKKKKLRDSVTKLLSGIMVYNSDGSTRECFYILRFFHQILVLRGL